MAESPSHKRSRSSAALSLLRRDHSKDRGNPPATISTDGLAPPSPSTSNQSPGSLKKLPPDAPVGTKRPDPDASDISLETAEKVCPSGIRSNIDVTSTKMSIEDSVKTFRLFEVLRSGDTAAIAKAVKDLESHSTPAGSVSGTTVLHLAVQCAEPSVVEYVVSTMDNLDINTQDREGNTALHLAAQLGRSQIVQLLLDQPSVNDTIANYQGRTPIDLSRTPEIFQQLQLAKSVFVEGKVRDIHSCVAQNEYKRLEEILVEPRVEGSLDVNMLELATDPSTVHAGGTLLHEAARRKDSQLAQLLLMHGADPFRRDRKGKLPQDVTKDDRMRGVLKKSPAAVVAQRGVQEKAILGSSAARGATQGPGDSMVAGKEAREMKGYLKKWTNYTSGYKLRWFVLEDGVLSYYKHQDDAGSACRGAINMRIAKLHMDSQDKTRFEIHGKSSVKYHLKANHVVEAKRWFWSLNNAIQFSKDEAKEDERRRTKDAEVLRQARTEQSERLAPLESADGSSPSLAKSASKNLNAPSSLAVTTSSSKISLQGSRGPDSTFGDDAGSAYDSYEPSIGGDLSKVPTATGPPTVDDEEDEEEFVDDASSREVQPASKDAFNITAQSAKLQLDLLGRVSAALEAETTKSPQMTISDPTITSALSTYGAAVSNLHGLVVDLLKISRDRDAYWQYRLDREADARKMWEDSMARVAQEHEELQKSIGESEAKRKRTKRALRDALEGVEASAANTRPGSPGSSQDRLRGVSEALEKIELSPEAKKSAAVRDRDPGRRKSVIVQFTELSDSGSDEDDEFFDAVDAGEVEVVDVQSPALPPAVPVAASSANARDQKHKEIAPSFQGYEQSVRKRLKLDADNRPKISLWGILKSMIGKDMTKMTLPVSFNEPTSLLQRVAEDMEYADLLDIAADRADSTERMLYVAAFAASEYASTIGRVAKPFNPLLGETYEYVRPDKGYRFFIEQVSHHPPIGAAYAESAKWDYYGESAVRSKFYGKSFDINPLGTWFLRLRPVTGGEELYTWKKVTSSVVGIITGNPTVDNYGPMEIQNWTTGETCSLDFKQRGWKASSAYQVAGKVSDKNGATKWSIGGRWNDKIYARLTPGFEETVTAPSDPTKASSPAAGNQAFLVWEAHTRPSGIPFNLTPFVVTLNAASDELRPHLPPTDTRLRPDQRAMEEGEYDFAATEKNRVEEKQRAKRRERENKGEEFTPRWFFKSKDPVTGEEFWAHNGEYWKARERHDWNKCEDIF
ncbi:MAG: hypothetical protein Q9227_000437 [Pyrenula ochraceoflavens]